jgi:hypothetical protein
MPIPHSINTLTFGGDIKPDDITDLLKARGIDQHLAPRAAGGRLAVTVPHVDVTSLPGEINPSAAGFDVRLDPVFHSGTHFLNDVEEDEPFDPGIDIFVPEFIPLGKPSPHAFEPAEISTTGVPTPPVWEAPPAGTRRPVVALLDCGVHHTHPWLPQVAEDPFVLDAEDPARGEGRWKPGLAPLADDHAQAGHATFIAGLIRMGSPFARVLSVRVMGSNGKVNENTVINALDWLLAYKQQNNPVDVVCMAFGRHPGDTEDQETLAKLRDKVTAVRDAGMQVVASAGNDHEKTEIFPAGWTNVIAVGSGQGKYHASFSNYGDWVDQFSDGVEMRSILPPDKWGKWSGTSFSVAVHAAELAQPRHVG